MSIKSTYSCLVEASAREQSSNAPTFVPSLNAPIFVPSLNAPAFKFSAQALAFTPSRDVSFFKSSVEARASVEASAFTSLVDSKALPVVRRPLSVLSAQSNTSAQNCFSAINSSDALPPVVTEVNQSPDSGREGSFSVISSADLTPPPSNSSSASSRKLVAQWSDEEDDLDVSQDPITGTDTSRPLQPSPDAIITGTLKSLESLLDSGKASILSVIGCMNKLPNNKDLKDFSLRNSSVENIGPKVAGFLTRNSDELSTLDFKNFSSVIAAFDKLGYRDADLFNNVFGRAITGSSSNDFSCIDFKDIANILHAFASLNICNSMVFKKLSDVIIDKLKSSHGSHKNMVDRDSPANISTILWAYAWYKSKLTQGGLDDYTGVVTKLIARYDKAGFFHSDADLNRLMQVRLVCDLPITSTHISAYELTKKRIETSNPSRQEMRILNLVNKSFEMNFEKGSLLKDSHHIPDLIDIGKRVVIEYDGPHHFVKDSTGVPHINGSTHLRDFIMTQKDNLQVVSIPWFEWSLQKGLAAQLTYLKCHLAK